MDKGRKPLKSKRSITRLVHPQSRSGVGLDWPGSHYAPDRIFGGPVFSAVQLWGFTKFTANEVSGRLFLQSDQVHGLADEAIFNSRIQDEFLGKPDPFGAAAEVVTAEDAGDEEGFVAKSYAI